MTTFRSSRMIGVAALGLCWVGACAKTGDGRAGGETHWLGACERDEDCEEGACWCGICTRGCDGDGACREAQTACYSVASPGLAPRCLGHVPEGQGGICLGTCRGDVDCMPGSECLLGACVPAPRQDRDGGLLHRGPQDGGRPRAGDYVDVHVPGDFQDPVDLPPPDRNIEGDLSALVGTWTKRYQNLNDDVRDPATGPPCSYPSKDGTVCFHLEIRRGANGKYTATWSSDPADGTARVCDGAGNCRSMPQGPFEPATDPDVGYPTTVTPNEYDPLGSFVPGVQYRLFDGVLRDGVLRFWTSPMDLWSDWCGMQRSYRWDIDGRTAYRCTPQTADESNTDLGKLALCTASDDFPRCKDPNGDLSPCICVTPDGKHWSFSPLCSAAYCECTATECHADMRNSSTEAVFRLQDGVLVGTFGADAFFPWYLTFEKVAP